MFNHVRTLLANRASDTHDPSLLGEQPIPSYRPITVPDSVQGIRRLLFGETPDAEMINYRLNQLLPIVHRTPRHIYAQIIAADGGTVVAAVSTVQKEVREALDSTGSVAAAALVGRTIADKAKAAGVAKVAFDRSGFRYHGRVKALADAARENGLEF